MINICNNVLQSCYLKLNEKKSVCLRIGPRYKFMDCNLSLNGQTLNWKNEIGYLCINILSGKSFKCNLQPSRQKFFWAVNGIFGKIGLRSPHNLMLSLIESFCIPILMFGLEGLYLCKSDREK